MSTLQAANIQSLSSATLPVIKDSAGTEYGRFCRAFVNFDGTTSPGTIRTSFNVSSVTKNTTGDYTVNFTNAFSDANYTVSFGGQGVSASGWWRFLGSGAASVNGFSASSYRFQTPDVSWAVQDTLEATLTFFR